MTSAFVSRWPVLQEHPVTAGDLDADGVVRDQSVARWVAAARAAYLDRCTALRRRREESGLVLQDQTARLPPGALLGRPDAAVVTAGGGLPPGQAGADPAAAPVSVQVTQAGWHPPAWRSRPAPPASSSCARRW